MNNMVRTTGTNQYQERLRPDDPRLAVPDTGLDALPEYSGYAAVDDPGIASLNAVVSATGTSAQFQHYVAQNYGSIHNIPAEHIPQVGIFMVAEGMRADAYEESVQKYMDIQAGMIKDIKPSVGADMITRAESAKFNEWGHSYENGSAGISSTARVEGETVDENGMTRVTDYQLSAIMSSKKPRDFAEAPDFTAARYRMALENVWDCAQDYDVPAVTVTGYDGHQQTLSTQVAEGQSEEDARNRFMTEHDRNAGAPTQAESWAQALYHRDNLNADAAARLGVDRYLTYAQRVQGGYLDGKGRVLDARQAAVMWRENNPTAGDYAKKAGSYVSKAGAFGAKMAIAGYGISKERKERKRLRDEEELRSQPDAATRKRREQMDYLVDSHYNRQLRHDRKIF